MAGIPWRIVLTTLSGTTLTFLDRYSINRKATYTLNAPSVFEGDAFSDNSEVNIAANDGDPFLSEGNRLLYGFRREGLTSPWWVCRFGGIVQIVEDRGADPQPLTHFQAFDPWQYMMSRPIVDSSGQLPVANGLTFTQTAANTIVTTLLANSLSAHGSLHLDWGQSGHYGGHIDTLPAIDITFPQGMSLGEALQKMCDGDYMDIVIRAVYDPVNRAGYVGELSIYAQAGSAKNGAVFAWDMASRSLVGIDRLIDGTQRANNVLYFTGVGGGGGAGGLATDSASQTKYGQYWLQRSSPGVLKSAWATELAASDVILRKNGKRTLTVDPAPERSPSPFTEYFLGDSVPIYASSRFRQKIQPTLSSGVWTNIPRVYQIPITIQDDTTEVVEKLLVTADWQ